MPSLLFFLTLNKRNIMATKAVPRLITLPAPVLPHIMVTLEPVEARLVGDGVQALRAAHYTRLYTSLPFVTRVYKSGKFIYPAFTKHVVHENFDVLTEDAHRQLDSAGCSCYDADDDEYDSDAYDALESELYDAATAEYESMAVEQLVLTPPATMCVAVTVSVSDTHGLDLHICLVDRDTGHICRLPTPNTCYSTGIMCNDQGVTVKWRHLLTSLDSVAKYFSCFESSEWSLDMIESAPVNLALDLLRWDAKTKKHSPAAPAWKNVIEAEAKEVLQDVVVRSCVQATKTLTAWRRSL